MLFVVKRPMLTVFCPPVHGPPFVDVQPFPPLLFVPVLYVSLIVDPVVDIQPFALVTPFAPVPHA